VSETVYYSLPTSCYSYSSLIRDYGASLPLSKGL
jgi:hypothetical protein